MNAMMIRTECIGLIDLAAICNNFIFLVTYIDDLTDNNKIGILVENVILMQMRSQLGVYADMSKRIQQDLDPWSPNCD